MGITIETLDMRPGDSLIIYLNGSAENSIAIHVNQSGEAVIQGPMNEHNRAYRCEILGWEEVRKATA